MRKKKGQCFNSMQRGNNKKENLQMCQPRIALLPLIWDSFSQKTLSLLVIVVSPTKTYSLLHFLGYKTFWREVYKTSTLKMENFWGNIFVGRELFSSEVKEEMISIEAAVENRCGQKIANQSSLRNCCGSWKSLWSFKTLNFKLTFVWFSTFKALGWCWVDTW